MEIKINDDKCGIEISDDFKDIIKSSEDIAKIMEQMNKIVESKNVLDENKIKLYKEVFVGAIGIIGALGIGKMVESLVDNPVEKNVSKKELIDLVTKSFSDQKSESNRKMMINDAINIIAEIETGIRQNCVIKNIKINSYDPVTKTFNIAA